MNPAVIAALITSGVALLVGVSSLIINAKVSKIVNSRQAQDSSQDRTYQKRHTVYSAILGFADDYQEILDAALRSGDERRLNKVLTEFVHAINDAELVAPTNVRALLDELRKAIRDKSGVVAARKRFSDAARADLTTVAGETAGS
jgi:hypothetical protein